ncbi:hypothetical protein DBL67_23205 [Paenibacillus polymyxa]|jgi:ABC-type polysaccharide/polyol phosphate transport system ATPase subunit|nr:hypothetical protein DBL67_23205 [Paenibacillus polymyxa]RPE04249.1 hypothetical protein EG487_12665 [Paenibacillus polymyxa]
MSAQLKKLALRKCERRKEDVLVLIKTSFSKLRGLKGTSFLIGEGETVTIVVACRGGKSIIIKLLQQICALRS